MAQSSSFFSCALFALVGLSLGACGGDSTEPLEVPEIERERSLVWIDLDLVDDPDATGLARVMGVVSEDGHGGEYLRGWFNKFSTTSHSERLGPALLIEELEGELGGDASSWDLDALPFITTAVHNRIDLGARSQSCGELRLSFASTHPVYAPFHIIFLFRQPPGEGDLSGGEVHCLATAQRWASLSELSRADFLAEARDILDDTLVAENFLLAESVELTVSPWEWRQWRGLENPPLFQTVDAGRLNAPGAFRDDFVEFASANAEALMARSLEIPARFRPLSARVQPVGERPPLELDVAGYSGLAAEIEIMGCPACHTDDAEFVQTTPQRTFSDFYDKELAARAIYLEQLIVGDAVVPPFGPLQAR